MLGRRHEERRELSFFFCDKKKPRSKTNRNEPKSTLMTELEISRKGNGWRPQRVPLSMRGKLDHREM